MTTGEKLLELSTLTHGTAEEHLLNISDIYEYIIVENIIKSFIKLDCLEEKIIDENYKVNVTEEKIRGKFEFEEEN